MPDQSTRRGSSTNSAPGATIVLQGLHRLWPPSSTSCGAWSTTSDIPSRPTPTSRRRRIVASTPITTCMTCSCCKSLAASTGPSADRPPTRLRRSRGPTIGRRSRSASRPSRPSTPCSARAMRCIFHGGGHSARALGQVSIHLTIGVSILTGIDVLRAVVDQLEHVADLRKSLPMGIDATDQNELTAMTTKLIAEVTETMRDRTTELGEEGAARLAQRFAERTRPVSVRPLASLEAAEHPRPPSACAGVTAWWPRFSRRASGCFCDCQDRDHFPESCADALAELRRGPIVDAVRYRIGQRRRRGGDPQTPARRGPPPGGSGTAPGGERRMTTATDRAPCSDQSLARNDPMYGTASAGVDWLMLELAGPWGISAFLQSPTIIEPHSGRSFRGRVPRAAGMRIAAIRRHGRRSSEPRWRWFVGTRGWARRRCPPRGGR